METAAADNNRLEERSNIFLMGTLYAAGGSTPVRIRNLSRSGALVEAAALPPAATAIRLSRGPLSVVGEIVWLVGRKAGLRFATPVAPGDWLPMGERGRGQQLIDEVMHRARLGMIPAQPLDPPPAPPRALHDELLRIHQLLYRACEDLAADSAISVKHLMTLQAIDAAAAALVRLAADPHGEARQN